ncbi:MAG: serine hydrolase [Acidobacteria bacterium]|nr:MAG: serine hydrolase [Acidobacteriota bacterium]
MRTKTLAVTAILAAAVALCGCTRERSGVEKTEWPTREWAKSDPQKVGLDEGALAALDADLKNGKYPLVDSFEVFRCGKEVFAAKYDHDYAQIYGKEAKTRGPLNARLTGPYNYFDPAWHPYYRGTQLHSMQSVSKTVSSVIIGAAMLRGDFKAGLDTPVLKYFDAAKVKNVDERKRGMTLRHVLTMTAGLDWMENVPYDDPRSDSSLMEATDDWVQYVIDKPMAAEPGKVFNYSSGVSELLAHIFLKETGQDIDTYGEKYLFQPLGIEHYWKRTPLGAVDTEGGLYLRGSDLAKIGYLYLHDGMWDRKQIVPKAWVRESVAPFIQAEEDYKYGFKWWLLPRKDSQQFLWMARGFGGQELMVFPEEGLIVVFTGWDILGTTDPEHEFVSRVLTAVRAKSCGGDTR